MTDYRDASPSVSPVDDWLRGLLAGTGSTTAPPLADDNLLTALIEAARANRVIGPTVWALHDAGVELPEEVTTLARDRLAGAMAWCLELELRLMEIREWFDRAGGVRFLVLKGAAVAHLDEVDPSQRSFADLDLLVHTADMDRALDALRRHGAKRRIPEHHRGFDRRFVKGVGLACDDGVEIDIHRTLCVGALGLRIPLDDLFTRPDHFVVGGERFATLRLEHRALHAAYHAVVGSTEPALHTVRDLARYLARPELSPDVLVPEARRWRGETVLWSAVRITLDTLPARLDRWREWAERFEPNERDLALITASRTESRWPLDGGVLHELTWRDRVAYAWGVAWPSTETLSDRGESRWERLAGGLARLVHRPNR